MKREFLESLDVNGTKLPKEIVDQIMAENGKDVQAEQSKAAAKDGELSKANETIKGLQEAVKKFDGVDVDKLKQSAVDWETKYNTDVAAERARAENLKKEYDLKDALKAQGVLDPDYLIFKHDFIKRRMLVNPATHPVGVSVSEQTLPQCDQQVDNAVPGFTQKL